MRSVPALSKIKKVVAARYPRCARILHIQKTSIAPLASGVPIRRYHVVFITRMGGIEDVFLRGRNTSANEWRLLYFLKHRPRPAFTVPHPLFFEKKTGFLLTKELWGDSLRRFSFTESAPLLPRIFKDLAISLAALHALPSPPKLGRARRMPDVALSYQRLLRRAPALARGFAPPSPMRSTKQRPPQKRIIHGDFQASNILFTLPEGKLGLVDFADAGMGDPLRDVASFCVHTRIMLRGVLPRKNCEKLVRIFSKQYQKTAKRWDNDILCYYSWATFYQIFETTLNLLQDRRETLAMLNKEYRHLLKI